MKVDELEKTVLELAARRPEATVEELVDELAESGYKKYDAFKAVESAAAKGLLELFEAPDEFDPYRPAWTRTVRLTERGRRLVEGETSDEGTPSVTLVLTHPFPTTTKTRYVSFFEAVELLVSESDEVVGVVGFVDVSLVREALGYVVQKLRKPISLKILCSNVTPESDDFKERALRALEALGVKLELVEVSDEHGRNLHAKFLVSGDLSYVGSHNFLKSSLSRNLEVGLLVKDGRLASELRKTFSELWREFRALPSGSV